MIESPRVVIVDDAAFSRSFLKKLLTGEGLTIAAEGADGFDAVELYEKHKPDLMTLDVVMPGMDGISALSQILKRDPSARVIVCSSLTDEAVLLKAIKVGARDFVTKPIEPERFLDAVRKSLGSKSSRIE